MDGVPLSLLVWFSVAVSCSSSAAPSTSHAGLAKRSPVEWRCPRRHAAFLQRSEILLLFLDKDIKQKQHQRELRNRERERGEMKEGHGDLSSV